MQISNRIGRFEFLFSLVQYRCPRYKNSEESYINTKKMQAQGKKTLKCTSCGGNPLAYSSCCICLDHPNSIYCFYCPSTCCTSHRKNVRFGQCKYCGWRDAEPRFKRLHGGSLCCQACVHNHKKQCFACSAPTNLFQDGHLRMYLGETDTNKIQRIIAQITPLCEHCQSSMKKICLEKSCKQSQIFCCFCQKSRHLTHRTNDLRLLCVDRKYFGSYLGPQKKQELTNLKRFIEQQRERCADIVREQTQLAELLTENIQQLELFLSKSEDSWEESLEHCIQQCANLTMPPKQARKIFKECLSKINLDFSCFPKTLTETQQFLQKYQKSYLRQAEVNYGKKIYDRINKFIELDKGISKQRLIKRTPIEKYAQKKNLTKSELALCDFSDRGMQIAAQYVHPNLLVSRLVIDKGQTSNPNYEFGFGYTEELLSLQQLHTPFYFETLPQKLQSLTLDLTQYKKTSDEFSLQSLPVSLNTLRISISNFIRPLIRINASELYNLKYFVLCDPLLTPALAKPYINFAIKNNLRVLCLVKSPPTRNYSKISNWEHRFETSGDHLFPQLRTHYLAYQRKMQQVVALRRSVFSRLPESMQQDILEASSMDVE